MKDRRTVDEILLEWDDQKVEPDAVVLSEMSRSEFSKRCHEYFRYYTKRYWPEHEGEFPEPEYTMRGRNHEGGVYSPLANMILINTDLGSDDAAFRSVFVHEMIHYYDAMLHGRQMDKEAKGHGTYFNQMKDTINRSEGKDFIRQFWLADQMGAAVKPFYVYIVDTGRGNYATFWASERSEDIIARHLKAVYMQVRGGNVLAARSTESAVAYVAQTTSGILHRGPRVTAKGKTTYELVGPKDATEYEAIKALTVAANAVNPFEAKASEAEPYCLYLIADVSPVKNTTDVIYFWSPKRNEKLFPFLIKARNYYNPLMKIEEPHAWAIPMESKLPIRGLSSVVSASVKPKVGGNIRRAIVAEHQPLLDALNLLTPSNEIDLKAIKEEEPAKTCAYLFSKNSGADVIGLQATKVDDRAAENIARFDGYEEVYRLDEPTKIMKILLPVNKKMGGGFRYMTLSKNGKKTSSFAADVETQAAMNPGNLVKSSNRVANEDDGRFDERRTIVVGGRTVEAEIADDPDEQVSGFRGLPEPTGDRGILFVYRDAKIRRFTMDGVDFPLSLAFIDDGKITQIVEMEPNEEGPFSSISPASAALEMAADWFAQNNVGVGASVEMEERREELAERDLHGGTPDRYYLVFNLLDDDENMPWVDEIVGGHMKGVVGVSSDPRIVKQHSFRGGLLVMDGTAFAAANKLSRIQYENPHYLVQDDLAALKRMFNTRETKDVLNRLAARVIYLCDNAVLKEAERYNDFAEYSAEYIEKKPHRFKGFDDLANWMYDAFSWSLARGSRGRNLKEHVDRTTFRRWLTQVFENLNHEYQDEGEWVVKTKDMVIPKQGTRVYAITEDRETLEMLQKIWTGEDIGWVLFKDHYKKTAHIFQEAGKRLKAAGFPFEVIAKEDAGAKAASVPLREAYRDVGFADGKHWGRSASGILFTDGDRILLLRRSRYVEEPGTWAPPGGAIPEENGRPLDAYVSACKECTEEMGSIPPHRVVGKYVYRDGDFTYTTFIAHVEADFHPRLDHENDDYAWIARDDLKKYRLHPGFAELLKHVDPFKMGLSEAKNDPFYQKMVNRELDLNTLEPSKLSLRERLIYEMRRHLPDKGVEFKKGYIRANFSFTARHHLMMLFGVWREMQKAGAAITDLNFCSTTINYPLGKLVKSDDPGVDGVYAKFKEDAPFTKTIFGYHDTTDDWTGLKWPGRPEGWWKKKKPLSESAEMLTEAQLADLHKQVTAELKAALAKLVALIASNIKLNGKISSELKEKLAPGNGPASLSYASHQEMSEWFRSPLSYYRQAVLKILRAVFDAHGFAGRQGGKSFTDPEELAVLHNIYSAKTGKHTTLPVQLIGRRIKKGESLSEYLRELLRGAFAGTPEIRKKMQGSTGYEYFDAADRIVWNFADSYLTGEENSYYGDKTKTATLQERLAHLDEVEAEAVELINAIDRNLSRLEEYLDDLLAAVEQDYEGRPEGGITDVSSITVGPFTIINKTTAWEYEYKFLAHVLKETQRALKREGFGFLCYGNVILQNDLGHNPWTPSGVTYAHYRYNSDDVEFAFSKMNLAQMKETPDNFKALGKGGNYAISAMIHELGHRLFMKKLTPDQRDRFKEMYKEALANNGAFAKPPGDPNYGKANEHEDFATEFEAYVTMPETRHDPSTERMRTILKDARMLREEAESLDEAKLEPLLKGGLRGVVTRAKNLVKKVLKYVDPESPDAGPYAFTLYNLAVKGNMRGMVYGSTFMEARRAAEEELEPKIGQLLHNVFGGREMPKATYDQVASIADGRLPAWEEGRSIESYLRPFFDTEAEGSALWILKEKMHKVWDEPSIQEPLREKGKAGTEAAQKALEKALDGYIAEIERQLDLLQAVTIAVVQKLDVPTERGERTTDTGKVTVGRFTLINQTPSPLEGSRNEFFATPFAAELARATEVLERVTETLKRAGFGQLAYGDVFLSNYIPPQRHDDNKLYAINAFYDYTKDHFYLTPRPQIEKPQDSWSARERDECVRVMIHELGHRLYRKKLASGRKQQFKDLYDEAKANGGLFVSNYAKSEDTEDFAEQFAALVRSPRDERDPYTQRIRTVLKDARLLREDALDEATFASLRQQIVKDISDYIEAHYLRPARDALREHGTITNDLGVLDNLRTRDQLLTIIENGRTEFDAALADYETKVLRSRGPAIEDEPGEGFADPVLLRKLLAQFDIAAPAKATGGRFTGVSDFYAYLRQAFTGTKNPFYYLRHVPEMVARDEVLSNGSAYYSDDDRRKRFAEIEAQIGRLIGNLNKVLIRVEQFAQEIADAVNKFYHDVDGGGTHLTDVGSVAVGRFTVINKFSADQSDFDFTVTVLKEAERKLTAVGLKKLCYGKIELRKSLGKIAEGPSRGEPAYARYNYKSDAVWVACYYAMSGAPISLEVAKNPDARKAKYAISLMIHELGHRLWFKLLDASDRAFFKDLFNEAKANDGLFINNYASTDEFEDFAEQFSYYVDSAAARAQSNVYTQRLQAALRRARLIREGLEINDPAAIDEIKLSFNRSGPAFIPADYDTIIPGGGGYYLGLARDKTLGWAAYILDKTLTHRVSGMIASHRTKQGLIGVLLHRPDKIYDELSKIERASKEQTENAEPTVDDLLEASIFLDYENDRRVGVNPDRIAAEATAVVTAAVGQLQAILAAPESATDERYASWNRTISEVRGKVQNLFTNYATAVLDPFEKKANWFPKKKFTAKLADQINQAGPLLKAESDGLIYEWAARTANEAIRKLLELERYATDLSKLGDPQRVFDEVRTDTAKRMKQAAKDLRLLAETLVKMRDSYGEKLADATVSVGSVTVVNDGTTHAIILEAIVAGVRRTGEVLKRAGLGRYWYGDIVVKPQTGKGSSHLGEGIGRYESNGDYIEVSLLAIMGRGTASDPKKAAANLADHQNLLVRALVHEVGHRIYHKLSDRVQVRIMDLFADLDRDRETPEGERFITPYAHHGSDEYFCENLSYYVCHPERRRTKALRIFIEALRSELPLKEEREDDDRLKLEALAWIEVNVRDEIKTIYKNHEVRKKFQPNAPEPDSSATALADALDGMGSPPGYKAVDRTERVAMVRQVLEKLRKRGLIGSELGSGKVHAEVRHYRPLRYRP